MAFSREKLDPEEQSKKAFSDARTAIVKEIMQTFSEKYPKIAFGLKFGPVSDEGEMKKMAWSAISKRGFNVIDLKDNKERFITLDELDQMVSSNEQAKGSLATENASKPSQLIPNLKQIDLMAGAVRDAVSKELSMGTTITTSGIAAVKSVGGSIVGGAGKVLSLFSETAPNPAVEDRSLETDVHKAFADNISKSSIKNLRKVLAENPDLKIILTEQRIIDTGKVVYAKIMEIDTNAQTVSTTPPKAVTAAVVASAPPPPPPASTPPTVITDNGTKNLAPIKSDQGNKPLTTQIKGGKGKQASKAIPIIIATAAGTAAATAKSSLTETGTPAAGSASTGTADTTPPTATPASAATAVASASPPTTAGGAPSDVMPDTGPITLAKLNSDDVEEVRAKAKQTIYDKVLVQTKVKIDEGIEEEKDKLRNGGWFDSIKGFFFKLLDMLGLGDIVASFFTPSKSDITQVSHQVASTVSETVTAADFKYNGKTVLEMNPEELNAAMQTQLLASLKKNKHNYAGLSDENIEKIATGTGSALAEPKNFAELKALPEGLYSKAQAKVSDASPPPTDQPSSDIAATKFDKLIPPEESYVQLAFSAKIPGIDGYFAPDTKTLIFAAPNQK